MCCWEDFEDRAEGKARERHWHSEREQGSNRSWSLILLVAPTCGHSTVCFKLRAACRQEQLSVTLKLSAPCGIASFHDTLKKHTNGRKAPHKPKLSVDEQQQRPQNTFREHVF